MCWPVCNTRSDTRPCDWLVWPLYMWFQNSIFTQSDTRPCAQPVCPQTVYTHGLTHAHVSSLCVPTRSDTCPCVPCTLIHKIVCTHSLAHTRVPNPCVSCTLILKIVCTHGLAHARVHSAVHFSGTQLGHMSLCLRTVAFWGKTTAKKAKETKGPHYPPVIRRNKSPQLLFPSLNQIKST